MSTQYWYAPIPEGLASKRLTLRFGLRPAWNHHRELVIPKLGSGRFVRQFSWACASVMLHDSLVNKRQFTKSQLAHALEALANKALWISGGRQIQPFLRGSRNFARDANDSVRSAQGLALSANYVSTTWRQSATGSLQNLQLVSGGRFNRFALISRGEDLANAFLSQQKGRSKLNTWLVSWLNGELLLGDSDWDSLSSLISAATPTETEREIVGGRVAASCEPNIGIILELLPKLFPRGKLKPIPEVIKTLTDRGHNELASSVELSMRLGQLIECCRTLLGTLVAKVENSADPVPLSVAENDRKIAAAVRELKSASKRYWLRASNLKDTEPSAMLFSEMLKDADSKLVVQRIAERSDSVLNSYAEQLSAGPNLELFSSDGEDVDVEYSLSDPATDRLSQIWTLSNDWKGGAF